MTPHRTGIREMIFHKLYVMSTMFRVAQIEEGGDGRVVLASRKCNDRARSNSDEESHLIMKESMIIAHTSSRTARRTSHINNINK